LIDFVQILNEYICDKPQELHNYNDLIGK